MGRVKPTEEYDEIDNEKKRKERGKKKNECSSHKPGVSHEYVGKRRVSLEQRTAFAEEKKK